MEHNFIDKNNQVIDSNKLIDKLVKTYTEISINRKVTDKDIKDIKSILFELKKINKKDLSLSLSKQTLKKLDQYLDYLNIKDEKDSIEIKYSRVFDKKVKNVDLNNVISKKINLELNNSIDNIIKYIQIIEAADPTKKETLKSALVDVVSNKVNYFVSFIEVQYKESSNIKNISIGDEKSKTIISNSNQETKLNYVLPSRDDFREKESVKFQTATYTDKTIAKVGEFTDFSEKQNTSISSVEEINKENSLYYEDTNKINKQEESISNSVKIEKNNISTPSNDFYLTKNKNELSNPDSSNKINETIDISGDPEDLNKIDESQSIINGDDSIYYNINDIIQSLINKETKNLNIDTSSNKESVNIDINDVSSIKNPNYSNFGTNNINLFGVNVNLAPGLSQALNFLDLNTADLKTFVYKGLREFNTAQTATLFNIALSKENFKTKYKQGARDDYTLEMPPVSVWPRKEALNETDVKNYQKFLDEFEKNRQTIKKENKKDISEFKIDNTTYTNFLNTSRDIVDERYSLLNVEGVSLRVAGFLKIFPKRGPYFSNSQSEIKYIPFQFDPEISGDAKAAEYQGVSTLARSQSAQVYRKSTERSLTLTLDYVITGKKGLDSNIRDKSFSNWTGELIYEKLLPDLKGLSLPNIIGRGYKLAPPIVQVWYGGLNKNDARSVNSGLESHPAFKTKWFSYNFPNGKEYRSLFVCRNVSFEYSGGIIVDEDKKTRWPIKVKVTLNLTEIAPSVTATEIFQWRSLR